jgi:hypothetical protein
MINMYELCDCCGGKGTINDPKASPNMCYCGPNGENYPQVSCPKCGGAGKFWGDDFGPQKSPTSISRIIAQQKSIIGILQ